jgi:hypothetical protein
MLPRFTGSACLLAALIASYSNFPAQGQEKPYFVTYSQDLEEPGNLEVETKTAVAQPDGGKQFGATAMELEYGTRAWWTTELYLDGQATTQDSTLFTGLRIENRFRPLMRDHAVNPVHYLEFESISGADKTILEVVGHDGQTDLASRNGEGRKDHKHEGELKLILSSNPHDWNISENFIAEKNLGHAPWEFGYTMGATRPLRGAASSRECTLCIEKFIVGVEVYGGLGDTDALTIKDTSHYVAPLLGWQLPKGLRLSFSPGFGLTDSSLARVYRVGLACEFNQVGNLFHNGQANKSNAQQGGR